MYISGYTCTRTDVADITDNKQNRDRERSVLHTCVYSLHVALVLYFSVTVGTDAAGRVWVKLEELSELQWHPPLSMQTSLSALQECIVSEKESASCYRCY